MVAVAHSKVSSQPDDTDTTLVRPSDWNAGHVVDFGEVGDIAAETFSATALAGATGEIADAGHRHAMPAYPNAFGNQTISVGPVGSGATFNDIQTAVESITDSSSSKRYTILMLPGVITPGALSTDEIRLDGLSGTKDYISLIGIDRDECVISRPASPGSGNAVLVTCDHSTVANLTLTSPVSRLIHWDRGAGAQLLVDNVSMPVGGGGNGLSCGASGNGSRLEVRNCYIGSAGIGVHGGSGSSSDFATLIFQGNIIDFNSANWLGLDLATSLNSFRVYLSGNVAKYFDVDASHAISLALTEGATNKLMIYSDFGNSLFRNTNAVTRFWNRIAWPQTSPLISTTAWAEAEVLVVTPTMGTLYAGSVARTTSANASFPVVAIDQEDSTGSSTWAPRVATGTYAEVTCTTAGAVAVGDILCTSTTAGQAVVNNAQTDPAKILGYAMTAKSAAVAGKVVVKLSHVARSW